MSYSKKLEDLIDHFLISNEKVQKKKQMGGVGYLINGNMCFGIYEDLLVLRVGNVLARTLVQKSGIDPFPDSGDEIGGFVSIKPGIYEHDHILHKFLTKGIESTSQLPAKKEQEESGLSDEAEDQEAVSGGEKSGSGQEE